MTQQLFVGSPKFSAPVMTLDSRDRHRDIRAHSAKWKFGRLGTKYSDVIFAAFYVTSRLQEQFF